MNDKQLYKMYEAEYRIVNPLVVTTEWDALPPSEQRVWWRLSEVIDKQLKNEFARGLLNGRSESGRD